MKYIIMCGGKYPKWETPRQLTQIRGEPIIARTIRLLNLHGVNNTDIYISSNSKEFKCFGVQVLHHSNSFIADRSLKTDWVDAFYPMNEPVCYLFGDVVFSPAAIGKIVSSETNDILFFASAYPFGKNYPKRWGEPFAFKVINTEHFKQAIADVKRLTLEGKFIRHTPIAWELWNVIRRGPDGDLNTISFNSYIHINDYTCDIDGPEDVKLFEGIVDE